MSNVETSNTTVLQTLIVEVEKVVTRGTPVLIAIDGNCGSGKTFYAGQLAKHFCASLVHCDDFFLPRELRTEERLAEVGGNIHYERLRDLLLQLKNQRVDVDGKKTKQYFSYMAYDCATDTLKEITQARSNVVIVEGSYALHPTLAEFYDLKILFTVDAQTQRERLAKREGERIADFVNKWIPLENRYFATLNTTDCVVIDTSKHEKY